MNDEEYIKIFNQDNMPMSEPGSSTSSDRQSKKEASSTTGSLVAYPK